MGIVIIIVIVLIIGYALGVFTMCLFQINKKECLHCGGTDAAAYCEKCYQDLISKNMKLKLELNLLYKKISSDIFAHPKQAEEVKKND